jgi:potassium-transporting ATPase KdpC subunit
MSEQMISTTAPIAAPVPQQSSMGVMSQTVAALRLLLVLTLITGVIYPLFMTLVGQIVFPFQANGSLEHVNGVIVGSALIGQANNDPRYFQGRPSAVAYMESSYLNSETDKVIGSSGASNLSPSSMVLQEAVAQRAIDFRTFNNLAADAVVPPDMLFASGSGLDPHISPQAAALQVARVAEARGLTPEQVQALVAVATEGPQFGLFGQPRVNVLELNLALDRGA